MLAPPATFDNFDVDEGGSIDAEEFQQLMKSIGMDLTEKEAEKKLKDLDTDGIGTIGMGFQTLSSSCRCSSMVVKQIITNCPC